MQSSWKCFIFKNSVGYMAIIYNKSMIDITRMKKLTLGYVGYGLRDRTWSPYLLYMY